jgi:hypothetical protein
MASKTATKEETPSLLDAPPAAGESAVATRTESAVAVGITEEELFADANAGHEEERADDLQIPTLVIVQAMSPQLKPAHAAYLPEAKPGMILDTLTGRLFDGTAGVELVSCYFRPVMNLMKMAGGAGEWVETWSINDPKCSTPTKRDDKNRDVLLDVPDHYLQLVAEHYVLLVETREFFAVRMKRTQIRPSKRWNSLLSKYFPLEREGVIRPRPRFGMVSRLRVVHEEKNGNDWYNWSPEIVGLLTEGALADPMLYRQAKAFYELVKSGRVEVKADAEELRDTGEDA